MHDVFGARTNGLRMLELGDQVIDAGDAPERTGKEFFTNRGFEHTSVDLNGKHGAIVKDLTKPEQFVDWHGQWDVVTNSGTTEHVEPFEAQYECYRIIHDCLRVGGVAVHLIPDVDERDGRGAWKNHCRYYYSEAFFNALAKACDYEVLSNTVINGLRCAALKKTKDTAFMRDRESFLRGIAVRDIRLGAIGYAKKFARKTGLVGALRRSS
jgi:hypothetical protein